MTVAKAVAIAVAVIMAVRDCHKDMKLASCWWHTMVVVVAVAVSILP